MWLDCDGQGSRKLALGSVVSIGIRATSSLVQPSNKELGTGLLYDGRGARAKMAGPD